MTLVGNLLTVYATVLLLGLPLFILVAPGRLRTPANGAVLAPILGFAVLSIVSAYVLAFGAPITNALPVTVVLAAAFGVTALWKYQTILASLPGRMRASLSAFTRFSPWPALLGVGLCLLVATPSLSNGAPTTPYRIGIDEVGYAETSQFLRAGGTLQQAALNIERATRTTNLSQAKKSNLEIMRFGAYVDSEFLLKAYRWGFPASVATFEALFGKAHSVEAQFPILIVMTLLLFGIARLAFSDLLGVSPRLATVLALALALNANALNSLFEGQYAQVFTMPFAVVVLWLAESWRRGISRGGSTSQPDEVRLGLVIAIAFAGFLVSYSEGAFVVLGTLAMIGVLSSLFARKFPWQWSGRVSLALAAALVLVVPYSMRWVPNILAILSGSKNSGFPQPKWASPSEILGIQNLYGGIRGYAIVPRSGSDVAITAILSALVVTAIVAALVRGRIREPAFWLAPPLVVAVVCVKNLIDNRALDAAHANNYQFMKAYTMSMPLLVGLGLGAVVLIGPGRGAVQRCLAFLLPAGVLGAVIISGLGYLTTVNTEAGKVSADLLALQAADRRLALSQSAILTGSARIGDFMLTTLFPMNWLDHVADDKGFAIPPDQMQLPVILLSTSGNPCLADIGNIRGKVIFRNPTLTLVSTTESVRTVYDVQQNAFRWGRLLRTVPAACPHNAS